MDLLQKLFNEEDEPELLDGSQGLDELSGQEPFAIDAAIPSASLGGAEACGGGATDALWEDPFCISSVEMPSGMLDAEASGDGISGSSDMQLSDSVSAEDGNPVDIGILAKALDFSQTPADAFVEGLGNFSLSNPNPDAKGELQANNFILSSRKEFSDRGDVSESCKPREPAQSNVLAVNHRLPKVEDKDGDIETTHSSTPLRGKPRDKTTQRKLRNKESARRYREKQVAKRRQLENFTRNLADQNQQLEVLHDKLLSLTCAHPVGRPGPQTSTTPLQDINS